MVTIEHTASHHRARFSRDIDIHGNNGTTPQHRAMTKTFHRLIHGHNLLSFHARTQNTIQYSIQPQRVHYFIVYNLYVPLKIK